MSLAFKALVLKDIQEEFTEFIGFPNKTIAQKLLSDNELITKLKNINRLRLSA